MPDSVPDPWEASFQMPSLADTAPALVSLGGLEGLILDLDGVVTRTDVLHAAAWKAVCDSVLRDRAGGRPFKPFDAEQDYLTHLDGQDPIAGARAFFDARAVAVDDTLLRRLATDQETRFQALLAAQGVEIFPSSVELIDNARVQGVKIALVSASREAHAILEAGGIDVDVDVILDARDVDSLNLQSKPTPDMFLEAAKRLGIAPARTVIVDDTAAGVAAGRAGGFGLVVGVDRFARAGLLMAAGADIVVADLSELLPGSGPPLALNSMNAITSAMRGKRVAVFLDYDGTVTPIVDRPEDAILDPAMRSVIGRLAEQTQVAFISGRMKEEVRGFVGLDGVVYAGSHGFDMEGPDGLRFVQQDGEAIRPLIGEAARHLRDHLAEIEGALVEDKSFAIAVHYRLVSETDFPIVEAAVDEMAIRYPKLRKTGGKKVFELRPRIDWDKGKALLYLLDALRLEGPDVLTFYLGDDVTDQDAFDALLGRGIGIVVNDKPMPTTASFRIRSTGEVRTFLERLAGELGVGEQR